MTSSALVGAGLGGDASNAREILAGRHFGASVCNFAGNLFGASFCKTVDLEFGFFFALDLALGFFDLTL